jgi:hypothetical protein
MKNQKEESATDLTLATLFFASLQKTMEKGLK